MSINVDYHAQPGDHFKAKTSPTGAIPYAVLTLDNPAAGTHVAIFTPPGRIHTLDYLREMRSALNGVIGALQTAEHQAAGMAEEIPF